MMPVAPPNPFWRFWDVVTPIPMELFPHIIDQVQRQTDSSLTDDAGVAVPTWTTIYTNLICGVELFGQDGTDEWQQKGVVSSGMAWFPPQAELGALPVIDNRCRLQFGTLGDGSPRWLAVRWARDEADAGYILSCKVDQLLPGGLI